MVTMSDFGRKITFSSRDRKNLDGRLEVFAIGQIITFIIFGKHHMIITDNLLYTYPNLFELI
jgi:hypothetical protein